MNMREESGALFSRLLHLCHSIHCGCCTLRSKTFKALYILLSAAPHHSALHLIPPPASPSPPCWTSLPYSFIHLTTFPSHFQTAVHLCLLTVSQYVKLPLNKQSSSTLTPIHNHTNSHSFCMGTQGRGGPNPPSPWLEGSH